MLAVFKWVMIYGGSSQGAQKGSKKEYSHPEIWLVNNLVSCPLLNLGVGNTSENAAFFKCNVFFSITNYRGEVKS